MLVTIPTGQAATCWRAKSQTDAIPVAKPSASIQFVATQPMTSGTSPSSRRV